MNLSADLPCLLGIAGTPYLKPMSEQAQAVALPQGELELSCQSLSDPSVLVRQTVKVLPKKNAPVFFAMQAEQARVQLEKQKQAAARELAQKEQERLQVLESRWQVSAWQTVMDVFTGLEWKTEDAGRDMGWREAQQYCLAQGQGWRLPSADEVLTLRLLDLPPRSCGVFTCRVSKHLRLSTALLWAHETGSPGVAGFVHFQNGERYAPHAFYAQGQRALCVRQP